MLSGCRGLPRLWPELTRSSSMTALRESRGSQVSMHRKPFKRWPSSSWRGSTHLQQVWPASRPSHTANGSLWCSCVEDRWERQRQARRNSQRQKQATHFLSFKCGQKKRIEVKLDVSFQIYFTDFRT